MTERPAWFPALEPPPGGTARLRSALREREAGGLTPLRAAFAALALVALAALPFALPALLRPDPVAAALERIDAAPSVRVAGGAAVEVASARADVQVFLVVASEATVPSPH